MNWEPDDSFRSFNAAELDRESRIPDEPYASCVEQPPQDAPASENGATDASAPGCSTEDAEYFCGASYCDDPVCTEHGRPA